MLEARLKKILSVFEGKKGALISIFQRIQEEFGYLPEDALSEVARFLKIPPSQVFSVATFYAHFYLTRRGDQLVRVCQGTACHVRGARDVLETAQHRLGIKTGQTTEDYKYSLERVACVGSCANAPVIMIDDDVHAKMTPGKLVNILSENDECAEKSET
ncbi:MAG: NADH-quinone oxidoreductase subunit NuoE [Desulfobacterales bacterium]|nr:NADH-quinone oxidoreductase subunit NuoE [Desulfobacterales bacterium]